MLETFTVATFSPYVGQVFWIQLDATRRVELELIEAAELKTPSGKGDEGSIKRAPFSLTFRGTKDILLPQRIYPFEHPVLGSFEIFIVPIGLEETGLRYEAVFT